MKTKYQEALDKIKKEHIFIEDYLKKEIDLIQELVDKETPRKVTHQATIYSCFTCPNCLNVVDKFEEDYLGKRVRIIYDYCIFCGQHLDWSDIDD